MQVKDKPFTLFCLHPPSRTTPLGCRHLLIECANAKASAFAERLDFTTYDNRRNWVASVDTLRESLVPQTA